MLKKIKNAAINLKLWHDIQLLPKIVLSTYNLQRFKDGAMWG